MEITTPVLPCGLDWWTGSVGLRDGWLEFTNLQAAPEGLYSDTAGILGDFLRLRTVEQIVSFAECYGPLGWDGELVEHPLPGMVRERVESWTDQVHRMIVIAGIYVGLAQWAAGAPDGLDLTREMLRIAKEYDNVLVDETLPDDDDDLVYQAEAFIAGWSLARFEKLEFWLVPSRLAGGERGRFAFAMRPQALIDLLDLEMAQSFAAGADVRYCANATCGAPFVVRHKRMRFCSQECAHRTHSRQSMARYRARQRHADSGAAPVDAATERS